jgi:ankyrin repeat protein
MQYGTTPSIIASRKGHTETLSLLLANKADINAASKVHQFEIFKYVYLIDNELQDLHIVFSILSSDLAHQNMNY